MKTDAKAHQAFEAGEFVERYVRGRLGDEERRAFEEHVLECDACFDSVHEMQRFVSGVRQASQAGLLDAPAQVTGWRMAPVLAYVALTALLVASGAWIWTLRTSMDVLTRQKAALADQLTRARSETETLAQRPSQPAAGLLPLVMLDTSRTARGAQEIAIPSSASQFALWIQVDAESTSTPLELQVSDSKGVVIEALSQLYQNRYGALAITLPSAKFPAGTYWVRVFREGHVLARESIVKVSIK
jgi:Putative zinc-finger